MFAKKKTDPPSGMPQFPLTGLGGGGADPAAEHPALGPPLKPPQLHVHGPEPATDDDVPVEQRLVVGADDAVVPFADPHAPFSAMAGEASTKGESAIIEASALASRAPAL